ncbi:MAG: magnesium-translocating P-type ATPase, partial [Cyanobacteria bacterium]|nr:magnesium-translocating P-type ATPase [Cyanobacteriota bacterium]
MEKTEIAGLTSSSVEALHLQFGYNEIRRAQRINVILQFASFFTNPLVVILLVASAISAFVGEATNSLIIATIVLFSVILDFTQSRRAQHAEELLKSKVSQTACVKRDGEWTEVPVRSIVPGDLVQLCAGDLVPADARIIKANDLHV